MYNVQMKKERARMCRSCLSMKTRLGYLRSHVTNNSLSEPLFHHHGILIAGKKQTPMLRRDLLSQQAKSKLLATLKMM